MKSRIYIWIIVSVTVLAGAIILFSENWSTTGNDFESFLIGDTEELDGVYIIKAIDTLEFKLKDSKWLCKDEVLNQSAVENLLLAAGRLSMTSIRSLDETEDFKYVMELVFMRGKKELRRYYFAREGQDYMVFSNNSEEGFGVELNGFEDMPLEKIFSDELDHYRMHLLVGLLPSEVKSIEIIPMHGSPFMLTQDNEFNIQVTDLQEKEDLTGSVDERKMRLLISYFSSIRYNTIIDESYILGRSPLAAIRVTDFTGKSNKLDVFPWYKPEMESPDMFEALLVFNDNPEVLSVDYYYLDLLMRGLEKYQLDQTD
jgi:hypothetical protein